MTSKTNYAMVGAFVLLLSAALIWGILWIGAGGPPKRVDYYLVYMTESVSGLNVDAPLKYRGVDVGKVVDIQIDPKNSERIRLLLQVERGTPVTRDTAATLEYQGLTGIADINLSGSNAASPPLQRPPGEEFPVIASRPSLFARLDSTMSDLLANLIQSSANINALLKEENLNYISRSIENAATLTTALAAQSDTLDGAIADLAGTLDNARSASEAFPQLMQQLTQGAEAFTAMSNQIRGAGGHLTAASAGIEEVVETSSAGLTYFTGTTLPDLAAIAAELRAAAENLRRASQTLAQNPSVLIYGNPAPKAGPGE